jgi:glycosyltransferase involved in cell wall biosynthesis
MKILAVTEKYLPDYNAGSELMMHDILIGLQKLGNEVVVVCEKPTKKVVDGIPIYSYDSPKVNTLAKSSDVIITHLKATAAAYYMKQRYNIPMAMIVHNNRKLEYNKIFKSRSDLLIFNSQWLSNESKSNIKSIIVNPPLIAKKYKTKSVDNYITLINVNKEKGGELFWKLAKKMPYRKFLAVVGAYGDQIVPRSVPKNVTIQRHTPDMKKVYAKTKILLIPSVYETWGKVGLEAACSGIPSIAHPTEGLQESLGKSGIFVDRNKIDQYKETIDILMDNDRLYKKYSTKSLQRSKDIAARFDQQIVMLNQALKNIQ